MVKSKETGPSLPYSHGQETAREGEGTVTLLSMGASETRRACLNLSGNLHWDIGVDVIAAVTVHCLTLVSNAAEGQPN